MVHSTSWPPSKAREDQKNFIHNASSFSGLSLSSGPDGRVLRGLGGGVLEELGGRALGGLGSGVLKGLSNDSLEGLSDDSSEGLSDDSSEGLSDGSSEGESDDADGLERPSNDASGGSRRSRRFCEKKRHTCS